MRPALRLLLQNAETFLQSETIETEAAKSYVVFDPLGVILGIMPWNFPFWQVVRWAVPTLAAGNVCVLKHASNVPLTAIEMEKIFRKPVSRRMFSRRFSLGRKARTPDGGGPD